MSRQFDNQANGGQPTNSHFYYPGDFPAHILSESQPTDTQTNWPASNYGVLGQSSSIAFAHHQLGNSLPNQPNVNPNHIGFIPRSQGPNTTTTTAGSEYHYGPNHQTVVGDGYYGYSSPNGFPVNIDNRAPVTSASTSYTATSRLPTLAPAPTRMLLEGPSNAGYPSYPTPHHSSFRPPSSPEDQFGRNCPISPAGYLPNPEFGTTSSPSAPRSVSSSPTLKSKRTRPYRTHAKNAKPSGSREVDASSSFRLSPQRLGLLPCPHPTLNRLKLSSQEYNSRKQLLAGCVWFVEGRAEPLVTPDDEFVKREYIRAGDRSRFCAFYDVDPLTKKHICRIDHEVEIYDEQVRCEYEVDKAKDAMAHVCFVLNYKPHPCEGKGQHARCERKFFTTERRNDHYSKENGGEEEKVTCEDCGISTRRRNFKRHSENCKSKVSAAIQS